ncbi:MAG TPA: alpha/beta fold hydrolase [Gammaproteobacteria bacterium]|nr:alpha/beta fold hydrolase [Gammaproteobacteria bacterium]
MKVLYLIVTPLVGILVLYTYLYLTDPTPDKFEVDRNLFPYQPHFLELRDGGRLHYIDEGADPILLLLHGNPTWSFLYRHIVAELSDRFRVIAPDYPGFGLSTAGEGYHYTPAEHARGISELVETLDLHAMVIMVQDWGGPVGFRVAIDNPSRIAGFVIGNTWAWPLERIGQKGFSLLMGGWPEQFGGQFGAWCCNMVARFFMSKGVANRLSDRDLAMYSGPFANRENRSPTHISPAQLRDASPFLAEIYHQLPTLADRPVLLTWGLRDFAFQEPERTRFESLFPKHETLLLENAAHFIQEDTPGEISIAITDWHKRNIPALNDKP